MLKDQIKKDIEQQVSRIVGKWDGGVEVTRAPDPKFGDYSTNIALRLAKVTKGPKEPKEPKVNKTSGSSGSSVISDTRIGGEQSPIEIANKLADNLKDLPYVEKLQVAGPGFLNFWIKAEYWQDQVEEVLKKAGKYGANISGKGKKARVEFVSANPTGPLHFGNARGGPIGDSISRVLEFSGWEVLREYLNNDRGNQIFELGKTVAARAGLIEAKEEELTYKGEYINELVERLQDDLQNLKAENERDLIQKVGEAGVNVLFEEIISDCHSMGIRYDYIVNESELQEKAKPILEELEKQGILKRKDGAVFFAPTSEYLKDIEAVVIKSDGDYTYFTADVVYHKEKFESGYDLVVDVFGSNTFGHVPKLKALAEVFGYPLTQFKVILYQFVRIKRGDEIVKMSKRSGNFVTAREVLEEVGKDAFRFFILMHDPNTHMDFDLELAKQQSRENPVYYVQYAHARISSILANVSSQSVILGSGATPESPDSGQAKVTKSEKVDYSLLTTAYELNLIKQISRFLELVEEVTSNFAIHRLTSYATELADAFHKFYENCKVITDDKELTAARLGLAAACQIALANTLALLGIEAPEKM